MGFQIAIPASVNGGFYKKIGNWAFGIMAHTLQCDQVWVFMIRYRTHRFGYRTKGDASPSTMTYRDAGFHWPWQHRWGSGRG